MNFILVFLIGIAIGFSLGIYFSRNYLSQVYDRRINRWIREIEGKVSSMIAMRFDEQKQQLIEIIQNLHYNPQLISEKISGKETHNPESIVLDTQGKELPGTLGSQDIDVSSNISQVQTISVRDNSELDNEQAEEETEFINNTSFLESFLESRNISIRNVVNIYQDDSLENYLDQIAIFMGDNYSGIKKFYERVKSTMNEGRSFSMNLKNEPQRVISNSCYLATELHRIAFLEEYRYFRSPKYLLTGKPSRNPKALNFLSGHWLERYVKAKLTKLIVSKASKKKFSYLINPQIILPNGDNFELDILCEIENEVYWFEAKTGNYQRHIEKYSKMISVLGIKTSQVFMILLDVDFETASKLSALYNLSIISIENAEEKLLDIINKHETYQNISSSQELKAYECTINSSGCNHIIRAVSEKEAWQIMANMYPEEINSDFTIVELPG